MNFTACANCAPIRGRSSVDIPKIWLLRIDYIKGRIQDGMATHLAEGQQKELSRDVYYMLEGLQQMMEETVLLFPDMTRSQHEAQEFCFAAPCAEVEWKSILNRCALNSGYLPYHIVEEVEDEERVALILRDMSDSDDDCLATGAYLRMVKEFTGMIYAVPYSRLELGTSIASIIARTAGVPPHQVRHVEI